MSHKSGFVNIIGHPNIGKSTLVNALMGEKMSIITSKPQTTRHRIHAILNEEAYQIVFSDTPGIIEDPKYKMHKAMNSFAQSSFEDADVLLFMTDQYDGYDEDDITMKRLKSSKAKKFLIINKIDLGQQEKLIALAEEWKSKIEFDEIFLISAKEKHGVQDILKAIINVLPEGPAYYPKDQTSDRNMRFFAAEMIREKILQQYKKEIPYAVEIVVERYLEREKDGKPLIEIGAIIFVSRKTHKAIIIGKDGTAIKRLGIEARKEIQKFLQCKIFLELYVKVKEDWRNNDQMLKSFGYES